MSGGMEEGRERIVQSKQVLHVPGFEQFDGALTLLGSGWCTRQLGHPHPEPHPHVVAAICEGGNDAMEAHHAVASGSDWGTGD